MDKLPKGWKLIVFGDYYDITSSKRVFESDWTNKGVPFYRAREIVKLSQNGFVDNDLFISEEMYNLYSSKYGIPKEDDLMITGVGTLGICYVVKKEDKFYFKDGNIIWFKKKSNEIYSRFVEYAFKSDYLKNQINNNTGATVGTYTIIRAKNTNLPLPPLPEQTRIVNKLDRLFKRIDKSIALLEENIKHTETLMASVLDEIFSKINAKRFQVKALSKNIQYGYTGKALDKGEYYYLRITDIQNGKVNYSNTPYSDIPESQVDKYVLKHGDILFARTGATAGKSYLFNDNEKSVFASYLIRVVCNEKVLIPNYLYCFFQSKGYWDQIFGNIVGAAQPNFNGKKLGEIIVPLPDIITQQKIIEKFESLTKYFEQITIQQQSKLNYLKALKASLLDKAFKGEL